MNYIIIILVFLINYLIWKYLLNSVIQRIIEYKLLFRNLIIITISLLLPYTLSLIIVVDFFKFSISIYGTTIILSISILSIIMFKNLKNE